MTEHQTSRAQATERGYDSAAQDFSERTETRSDVAAEFFDRFVNQLPNASVVADLGCGPGHDLRRLLNAGHRAIGVDRARGLLALCPTEALRVRGDLCDVPVSDGAIDSIWSSAALLHVDGAHLAHTFAEWNRVLRVGGTVGLATSLASTNEANEGWEIVPAGAARRTEVADGERRWFVHHERRLLFEAIEQVGWTVDWSSQRQSHRTWLQVLATKAA